MQTYKLTDASQVASIYMTVVLAFVVLMVAVVYGTYKGSQIWARPTTSEVFIEVCEPLME